MYKFVKWKLILVTASSGACPAILSTASRHDVVIFTDGETYALFHDIMQFSGKLLHCEFVWLLTKSFGSFRSTSCPAPTFFFLHMLKQGLNPHITYSIMGRSEFSIINGFLFMTKELPEETLSLEVSVQV